MSDNLYSTLTESQVRFLKWLVKEHECDFTSYTRSMILNILEEVNMNGRRTFLGANQKKPFERTLL